MANLKYSEEANLKRLGTLDAWGRVLVALLCTARILPAYRRFHTNTGRGNPDALDALFVRLWDDITGLEMSSAELTEALATCMRLIPREEDGWDEETQAYAENASASLAYTLRARLTGDPKEASWAWRAAYEAVDHFVIARSVNPDEVSEETVLSHPLVQAELQRQKRDLAEVSQLSHSKREIARLRALRQRSEEESKILLGVGL